MAASLNIDHPFNERILTIVDFVLINYSLSKERRSILVITRVYIYIYLKRVNVNGGGGEVSRARFERKFLFTAKQNFLRFYIPRILHGMQRNDTFIIRVFFLTFKLLPHTRLSHKFN